MWPTVVKIDGVSIDLDDVLADCVIRHGRVRIDDGITAASLQLRLRGTTHAESAAFHVGVPVELRAGELGHPDAPRFVGTITDASLDDDELTVIGIGPLASLSRYSIGDVIWPSEVWSARVERAFAEAGVPELLLLMRDDAFDPLLVARGTVDDPPQAVTLLAYLGTLSNDVGAAVVDLPDGRVLVQQLSYRPGGTTSTVIWNLVPAALTWATTDPTITWDGAAALGPAPLPILVVDPADVLYVPTWDQTLELENETTVSYGDAGADLAVTVSDAASITHFGEYPGKIDTELATLADATTRASERVARRSFPRWSIGSAPLLSPHDLHVGQVVELSGFPASSPHRSWNPVLEGWTDTIAGDAWNVELALSDPQLSGASLSWAMTPLDVAWLDVDPACAWSDATALDDLNPSLAREELSHAR